MLKTVRERGVAKVQAGGQRWWKRQAGRPAVSTGQEPLAKRHQQSLAACAGQRFPPARVTGRVWRPPPPPAGTGLEPVLREPARGSQNCSAQRHGFPRGQTGCVVRSSQYQVSPRTAEVIACAHALGERRAEALSVGTVRASSACFCQLVRNHPRVSPHGATLSRTPEAVTVRSHVC